MCGRGWGSDGQSQFYLHSRNVFKPANKSLHANIFSSQFSFISVEFVEIVHICIYEFCVASLIIDMTHSRCHEINTI